ncbi:DUF7683 domain-containing protein [Pseudomonas chlororaphis]|uniref:DUF7683 domain-containing protein n=1 Tax=Pseudomonas chlororaphis TaxID=587753 RepID=UPI001B309B52|nr:hypothetical protein [Pseudomonas chlororaphis]QTT91505.1 hypothetical protein HUT28_30225 [Pseudomonas chlororaphis]
MKYRVEAFDKQTECLVFEVELLAGCDEQLKRLMEWTVEQQGWEGYDLSADQLVVLEGISGRKFDILVYDFQLTVNS